ncbi:Rho guanine nucleotide exchange factor 6 [Mactra antiquata]
MADSVIQPSMVNTMDATVAASVMPSLASSSATSSSAISSSAATSSATASSATAGATVGSSSVKDNLSATKLFSSYGSDVIDSNQFPMQHATQQLPSNQVTIATTDPISVTDIVPSSTVSGTRTDGQSTDIASSRVSDSHSTSVTSDSSSVIPVLSVDQTDTSKLPSAVVSQHSNSVPLVSSVTSKSLMSSKTSVNVIKPTSATVMPVNKDTLVSKSSSTKLSGEIYGTATPSETVLSSTTVGLNSVSLKTTDAVPLTPLSSKPVEPAARGQSTILGGGLSDYIIYIGVPLCGLVILIFLIVCIVCIKRRKAKQASSPAKNRVQDLWVNNSRSDIPMTSQNNVPDIHVAESISPDEHIGCTSYEAVFDFKAEQSTHLSLKQGDLVRVNRKETAGWWRGTVGDQTGWFPSNYVQPSLQDNIKTENEVQMHDDSHISSFMVKNSLEQRQSYILNEPNHRKSTPTEEEIEAEPIYCKIQPKDKRKSGCDRSSSTTPTKSQVEVNKDTTYKDLTIPYIALYPFVARVHGELTVNKNDVILCRESDGKNGWTKARNENTGDEGYVPSTYIKKIEISEKVEEKTANEDKPAEAIDIKEDRSNQLAGTTLETDPYSYKQLEVNTNIDNKQDLVGIIHKAVHTFSAEKAGDLEFEAGELITVFQILENGWWLGCKEKTVGWFPGSFVEMLDHPSSSPSPSPASSIQSPSESPVPSEDSSILNEDTKPPSATESRSKLKPVRKAPPPPTRHDEPAVIEVTDSDMVKKPESKLPRPGGSRLPKMTRPKVAPPQPPCKSPDDSPSPLYDSIEKSDSLNQNSAKLDNEAKNNNVELCGTGSEGLYELIKETSNNDVPRVTPNKADKAKPPVPKRYIKPKLVTIPRTEVQLPDKDSLSKGLVNGDVMRLRSPPPPRPAAPKLGPLRAKLSAPKPLEDQIPNEEDNTYFHVSPQRKFDTFIRQESSERELELEDPYKSKGLSSFGSSFGSTFGKPAQNKQDDMKSIQNVDNLDNEISASPNNDFHPNKVAVLPVSAQVHLNGDTKRNIQLSDNGDIITPKGDNISHENKDIINDTNVFDSAKDKTENEVKPKSAIPITPKSKGSRLQPPKSVFNKDNSGPSDVTADQDNVVESPVDKTNKISKLKTPVTPKESPDKWKPDDNNVFQYPDVSYQKGVANSVERSSVGDVDNNIDGNVKHIPSDDDSRARSESFGRPPVAPKPKSGLPKPKTFGKKDESTGASSPLTKKSPSFDESPIVDNNRTVESPKPNKPISGLPVSKTRVNSESENEADKSFDESSKVVTPVSKIPLGSAIPHQSPGLRGRKSNIPSPGMRNHSTDRLEQNRQKSNSECESPVSPVGNLRSKPESPAAGRKGSPLQNVTGEQRSLRNRSNSPAGRTGIPTTVRNRSNSPAPKSPGIPVARQNSPKSTPKSKRGLVPPKKIHNGSDTPTSTSVPDTNRPSELPGLNSQMSSDFDSTDDSLSPKPDRPSKPPRVQKKKSPDGKPPKHGKSLLPVIHKSMESTGSPSNGVSSPSGGTKPRRGIPVAKPTRPPAPKSPPAESGSMKRTLYQAMRAYTAQNDDELSFSEGTFVKELSDCDRPGWFVGMLADGTTGLYPSDHFKPSPVTAQSEA